MQKQHSYVCVYRVTLTKRVGHHCRFAWITRRQPVVQLLKDARPVPTAVPHPESPAAAKVTNFITHDHMHYYAFNTARVVYLMVILIWQVGKFLSKLFFQI